MATYNGEKFLCEQLDSLFNQNRQFDELIVCDDCSSDGTLGILEEYAAKDSRIKIFRNERNLGFLKNFEKALSLTTGDYIALSDQDDIWLPNHIEILLNNIGDNWLAVGDNVIIGEDSRAGMRGSYLTHFDNFEKSDAELLKFAVLYTNPFQGASMMAKRDFIDFALPFPRGTKFHDTYFAIAALTLGKFKFIPEVITQYRFHGGNVTANQHRRPILRSIIKHLIKGHRGYGREIILDDLEKKLTMCQTPCQSLDDLQEYFRREKSMIGRIRNFFYEIANYRQIYG